MILLSAAAAQSLEGHCKINGTKHAMMKTEKTSFGKASSDNEWYWSSTVTRRYSRHRSAICLFPSSCWFLMRYHLLSLMMQRLPPATPNDTRQVGPWMVVTQRCLAQQCCQIACACQSKVLCHAADFHQRRRLLLDPSQTHWAGSCLPTATVKQSMTAMAA